MRLLRPVASAVAASALALTAIMPATALPSGGTRFDLGIDTSYVTLDGPGVRSFMATLDPVAQQTILRSCTHYLTTRNAARSQDTLNFCSVALATGTARTYAKAPRRSYRTYGATRVRPPAVRQQAPAMNLRPDCQFPHYTVDPTDPCY